MKEPILIIMAAGMGSRYGGLKQIDPITSEGEIIMDFSLYDAMMAGFKKVVFVIKEENLEMFKELIDQRCGKHMEVHYAFQKNEDLPKGYTVPEGREKPWGTAHAIYACREYIDQPFAVINADDYYGSSSFQLIYDFLHKDEGEYDFAMVSYQLKNTVTEHGHVARGVCSVSKDNYLHSIIERTKIMRVEDKICYTTDEGESWHPLEEHTPVSMNFWGYSEVMIKELEQRFPAFLDQALEENPLKAEYLIPKVTDDLLHEDKATVKVLESTDRWYGVTYKEDKPQVMDALQSLKDKGLYPEKLWK